MSRHYPKKPADLSGHILVWTGRVWLTLAFLFMTVFAAYMVLGYNGMTNSDDMPANPFKNGLDLPDVVFLVHLFFGVILTLGAALQLMPFVRNAVPTFHRWNGRLIVLSSLIVGLAGLVFHILKGNPAGIYFLIMTSVNGVLMVILPFIVWSLARQRRFDLHYQWAMRLFIVANGVWFIRLFMMASFGILQGPVGHTEGFTGPTDIFVAFGHLILPLLVLELYLRARSGSSSALRWAGVLVMIPAIGFTALGGLFSVMGMWMPRILPNLEFGLRMIGL